MKTHSREQHSRIAVTVFFFQYYDRKFMYYNSQVGINTTLRINQQFQPSNQNMRITNFKDIHIGKLIERRATELKIEMSRICNFMKSPEDEILKMYQVPNLDTHILLQWSKLLEYDFFRIYSQHIILYAPQANSDYNNIVTEKNLRCPIS